MRHGLLTMWKEEGATVANMQHDNPDYLLSQAAQCRILAHSIEDERMRSGLMAMASDYEERAEKAASSSS
jgi:hypothetical protein